MIFNKKGVSPIIAAVLLVVITIAIGATTMAFIRGLADQNLDSAREKAAQISCGTDVRLEVLTIGDTYKICKDTTLNSLNVTLKNVGSKTIKRLKLTVLGNDTAIGYTTNETGLISFEKNTISRQTINYDDTDVGTPLEYQLEPIIQGQPGQDVYCTDSPLVWTASDIADC